MFPVPSSHAKVIMHWAVLGCLVAQPGAASEPGPAAAGPGKFTSVRRVYLRGEQAEWKFVAPGAEAVEFDISGWLPQISPLGGCEQKDFDAAYVIDTRLLRPADYEVRARVIRAGQTAEQQVFPLTIAPPHDEARMPMWRWGGGGSPRFWASFGFNGGFLGSQREALPPGAEPAESVRQALDEAAQCDFDVGFYLRPLDSRTLTAQESLRVLLPDGSRGESVYPREPAAIDFSRRMTDSWMRTYADFPALRHCMFHSEIRTPYCLNPLARQLAQKEAGVDPAAMFAANHRLKDPPADDAPHGLIDDDNPMYQFLKWWWQRGDGVSVVHAEMARAVKAVRPDVITWHEPYRLAPVRGSHQQLDMIATWTYGHPDIKRLCYTTYLQAAARPERQLVQQNITLFVYGRFAVPVGEGTADLVADDPGDDPAFTAGPDYAREAIWLAMAQRPDCLAIYSAGSLSPQRPGQDPNLASPETFYAVAQTCDELVKPYGPLVKHCLRVPPETAVLMSAAATWFSVSPRLPGYPNEQTLPYASLLMLNHVPFDVLLDDDIVEGKLDSYRLLVMPKADTLTRAMHQRITDFARRGGVVIADKSLRASIPGARTTHFDLTHQTRIDGRYLQGGDAVTADQDRRLMDQYADQLAALLPSVAQGARSTSKHVLTSSLQAGEVRYHFFINDLRDFGPRFGQWRLRQELGVPQKAQVSVAVRDQEVLYDALSRRRIDCKRSQGRAAFELALPPARGKLVAGVPEPIDRVDIQIRQAGSRGQPVKLVVGVLGDSGRPLRGSLPLHIQVQDPLGREAPCSRYDATQDDSLEFVFYPAINDAAGEWRVRVTELVAGKTAEVSVACP